MLYSSIMDVMPARIPWRPLAASAIVFVTIIAFGQYFASHPEVITQLQAIPLRTVLLLFALYGLFVWCLSFINIGTLRLCRAIIAPGESLLLSMYSSVINFFGPLQSGPAFRAVYLKRMHNVKLRHYTAASLLYYAFYGLFSGIFLLSGALGWWLVPVLLTASAAVLVLQQRTAWLHRFSLLDLRRWHLLAAATFVQIALLAVIYYVELQAVAPGTTISQAIVYTGAANFALFVSITPGAIGFRESFLLLTQQLHGIDPATIIAANTLDRAIYIILLAILAMIIGLTHANRRFRSFKQTKS